MTEWDTMPVAARPPNYAAVLDALRSKLVDLDTKLAAARAKAAAQPFRSVRIAHRHHFSSALQRMSVVACVNESEWHCLVKGSPEALRPLFAAHAAPAWYTECYERLARQGLRVLALAHRRLQPDEVRAATQASSASSASASSAQADAAATALQRAAVESELHFAGFIAFECKVRRWKCRGNEGMNSCALRFFVCILARHLP